MTFRLADIRASNLARSLEPLPRLFSKREVLRLAKANCRKFPVNKEAKEATQADLEALLIERKKAGVRNFLLKRRTRHG